MVHQSVFLENTARGGSGPGDNGGLGGGGGILNSNNSLIAPPGQSSLKILQGEFTRNLAVGGHGVDGSPLEDGTGGGQGNGGAINNDLGAIASIDFKLIVFVLVRR